jgi:hypothetical protein
MSNTRLIEAGYEDSMLDEWVNDSKDINELNDNIEEEISCWSD